MGFKLSCAWWGRQTAPKGSFSSIPGAGAGQQRGLASAPRTAAGRSGACPGMGLGRSSPGLEHGSPASIPYTSPSWASSVHIYSNESLPVPLVFSLGSAKQEGNVAVVAWKFGESQTFGAVLVAVYGFGFTKAVLVTSPEDHPARSVPLTSATFNENMVRHSCFSLSVVVGFLHVL